MTGRRFEDRRAIVTGGGSGIGRACALQLAAEGAAVAVVDARGDAAEAVAAELLAAGANAIGVVADVGDEAAVSAAVGRAVAAFGGLDTVVAAAGIARFSSTHELTLADWELSLRVNLTGVFLVIKHAVPHLVAAGGGSIVTIGSVASLVAAGRSAGYDASKGGVLQLTKYVAVEYVEQGIRANCVCPGVVATGLGVNTEALYGKQQPHGVRAASSRIDKPMSRAAHPSEIAKVVAFLASDDASFVTGTYVAADGGYTAI